MLDRIQPVEFIRHIQHLLNSAKADRFAAADAIRLCEFAVPLCGDSLTSARWCADEKMVAFKVNHHPPLRQDRTCDLLEFTGTLLLCLGGGRLVNVTTPSGGKVYAYLRYEHPSDKTEDKRIRLNRIILDAPEDKAVGFVVRKAFRDYRRSNLKLRKPIKGMEDPKLGREAAIILARALYEASPPEGLSHVLSADAYEALLRETFNAADRCHGDVVRGDGVTTD
jgi:hypothetical protein